MALLQPSVLEIRIHLSEVAGNPRRPKMEVYARFTAGQRADGRYAELASDTLWVLGEPFRPDSVGDYHGRTYFPAERLASGVRVRPPALRDLEPPPEWLWSLPVREGSHTVTFGAGERPRLRLSIPQVRDGLRERWNLYLPKKNPHWRGPQDYSVLHGEGSPPSVLEIPDAALPFPGPTQAEFSYGAWSTEAREITAEYHIVPSIQLNQFWFVFPVD